MMRTFAVACMAMLALSACVTGSRERMPSSSLQPAAPRTHVAFSYATKISNLNEVETHAAKFPRDRTLIVFDIDDTLLTTPFVKERERKFFGSDRWYVWQAYGLPAGDPDKIDKCLFEVITANAMTAAQVETQEDAMDILARIPNDKLMLTSRSSAMKSGTDRQLASVGYAGIPSLNPKGGPLPIVVDGTLGLYDNGVFLTQGANKGNALLALLDATRRDYDYVILVDDTEKNILNMATVMAAQRIGYLGLRYTGVKNDPPFEVTESQIKAHRQDWIDFKAQHPDEAKRWVKNDCK